MTTNPTFPDADHQGQKPRKFRILFLAGDLALRGATVWLLNLNRELKLMGHLTHVLCAGGEVLHHFTRDSISMACHPGIVHKSRDMFLMKKLISEVNKFEPDLIHLQSPGVLKVGAKLARKTRTPFVVTVHTLQKKRLRIPSRWCAGIVAISELVREDLVNTARVPKELIGIVLNGVRVPPDPPPSREDDTKPVPYEPPLPVVGTIGALEASKGHEYLLRAAKVLLDRGIQAKFLIVGSGPEDGNLRRLARELEISREVVFAPAVHDFRHVLSSMEVFAMPSLQQSFGVLILEAMALMKPVVASAVGGLYSVVKENETGFLVPKRDSTALADAIMRLTKDPALARSMGMAGRTLVEKNFTASRMALETVNFYASRLGVD